MLFSIIAMFFVSAAAAKGHDLMEDDKIRQIMELNIGAEIDFLDGTLYRRTAEGYEVVKVA